MLPFDLVFWSYFSNSQHGCCERRTSDMDVRVHRCVRSQFTFPKYLVKISIEALTRMRYIPPNVPPKNTPTHQTQGLYSFSCPMVVASPCPGYTLVSSGSKKSFSRILWMSSEADPPGKSILPTESSNSVSPSIKMPSSSNY